MSEPSVQLACVGDVAISGAFLEAARPAGHDLTYPFAPLEPLLKGTDLILINLEGPLGRAGQPRPDVTSHIHNEADVIKWLASFPRAVCTLANNHMQDFGEAALTATLDGLNAAGIPHVGAGRTVAEANALSVVKTGGLRLGFLGFTSGEPHVGSVLVRDGQMGCASLDDPASVIDTVTRAAQDVDTLVVSLHWGREYHLYPEPRQVTLARQLVDHGATLVVGHHPHVQQGAEVHRHGLIAHSLGNLILPEMRLPNGRVQYRKPYTKQFAVLQAALGRRCVHSWSLAGGRLDRQYRLLPYHGSQAVRFAREMDQLAAPLAGPDYAGFWESYRRQREHSLQKESLRDAVAKLRYMDKGSLWSLLNGRDLSRNWRRLTRMMTGRPKSAQPSR